MGRPSLREERRKELVKSFSLVLARRGYEGATIAAVAAEAGVAPGLVHHYFRSKDELLAALLDNLVGRFRERVRSHEPGTDRLSAYVEGAIGLSQAADLVAARCWVGVFAEAVRTPALFTRVRRLVELEMDAIQHRSGGKLVEKDAGAVLAFVIGALVMGALAPRKTAGFAAPALHRLIQASLKER